MAKLIGYILGLVGLAGIVVTSIPQFKGVITMPAKVMGIPGDTALLLISAALVIIGIIFIVGRSGGKQAKEVPIYAGKNIVGFRRMGK